MFSVAAFGDAYTTNLLMKSKKCIVILPTHKNKKSGIEEAKDDIRHGRVAEYKDADEMFEKLGI